MKKFIPLMSLPLMLAACHQNDPAPQVQDGVTTVTVLGLNDFHGNLEPNKFRPTGTKAGGISAIAGLVNTVRSENPNTVFVGVGDLTGASPLSSSLLADEPSVIAMNKMGMAVNVLGNHEFDYGRKELERFQKGGCDSTARPDKACKFENPFPGAQFTYIASNVFDKSTDKLIFPAYKMVKVGDLNIAFVGAVLKDTPAAVVPTGVAGLEFRDEADSINAVIPEIKSAGADAIIALVHQGGTTTSAWNDAGCSNLTGPITDVAQRLDSSVNAVMSGHTHQAYNCVVDGRPVIQGASYGQLMQRLDLTVICLNGKTSVTNVKARNMLVDAGRYSNADMAKLAADAKAKTDPIAGRTVAHLPAGVNQVLRKANDAGESALGDVIADSQLAATRAADKGGAVIAFMNPGGIRADLPVSPSSNGNLTYGDIFTVQPFGNILTVMTLKGSEIKNLLEQQFDNPAKDQTRILQVSQGFAYSYDTTKPAGQRVSNITLNGQPLDMNADYRIITNNFLADGGDKFPEFTKGRDRLGGMIDVDAFSAYLQSGNNPVYTAPQGRITKLK